MTRYVHLNPVRARMVEHPAAWAWSSYPGYAHRGRRLEWVAYDELLASWGGAFGGPSPAGAYRRYVTAGLSEPPESPWKEAYHGWILGSEAFIDRVRAMVRGEPRKERRRESRLLLSLPLSRISDVVCAFYEIERAELSHRGAVIRRERPWPTWRGVGQWRPMRSWRHCSGCRVRRACPT